MRILVILPDDPPKKVLVELSDRQHIRNVKDLIKRKVYSEAIEIVLQKGNPGKEIRADEVEKLRADLILQEDSAYWDFKRLK